MAVTLTQAPAASSINPVNNPIWFCATSTQTAQTNFQFYVTVTIYYKLGASYTTKVRNYAINNPTDSILRFDSSTPAKTYIKNPIIYGLTAFQENINGILKVTVNVGERYGSTPTVYVGTDRTFYAWNGVLDYLDFPLYSSANYVCVTGSTFPILNDYPDNRLTPNSQNFLYLLANSDATIRKVTVRNSDGAINYSFDIANAFYSTGNWYDRYVRLNISPSVLESLGTVDFNPADGTYIYIDIYDAALALRKTVTFLYSNVCAKFPRYQLAYLNKKGAYDTIICELVSELSTDIKRVSVRHTPYYDESATGLQAYSQQQPTDMVLSTAYSRKILVRSNWLTASQSLALEELMTSPLVFIQDLDQASIAYVNPVNIEGTSYKINKNMNGKLFQLEATVSFANLNFRQRGT